MNSGGYSSSIAFPDGYTQGAVKCGAFPITWIYCLVEPTEDVFAVVAGHQTEDGDEVATIPGHETALDPFAIADCFEKAVHTSDVALFNIWLDQRLEGIEKWILIHTPE